MEAQRPKLWTYGTLAAVLGYSATNLLEYMYYKKTNSSYTLPNTGSGTQSSSGETFPKNQTIPVVSVTYGMSLALFMIVLTFVLYKTDYMFVRKNLSMYLCIIFLFMILSTVLNIFDFIQYKKTTTENSWKSPSGIMMFVSSSLSAIIFIIACTVLIMNNM
jgi:hypothetical protein